jgi:Polyketide cyclase / dehydrase and lipid transport
MSIDFNTDLRSGCHQNNILAGEIVIETRSHSAWGGGVTAQMYLPLQRSQVWEQLTDYPRWVHYFPDLICSEVLHHGVSAGKKTLYQVARKAFFLFNAQVEVYLKVLELFQHKIQFRLEKGSFQDFSAELKLQDYQQGTLLTYSVQATPLIPVPALFIEQAMQLDLPGNMKKMRQVICGH